jgi:hypothetical protein
LFENERSENRGLVSEKRDLRRQKWSAEEAELMAVERFKAAADLVVSCRAAAEPLFSEVDLCCCFFLFRLTLAISSC